MNELDRGTERKTDKDKEREIVYEHEELQDNIKVKKRKEERGLEEGDKVR